MRPKRKAPTSRCEINDGAPCKRLTVTETPSINFSSADPSRVILPSSLLPSSFLRNLFVLLEHLGDPCAWMRLVFVCTQWRSIILNYKTTITLKEIRTPWLIDAKKEESHRTNLPTSVLRSHTQRIIAGRFRWIRELKETGQWPRLTLLDLWPPLESDPAHCILPLPLLGSLVFSSLTCLRLDIENCNVHIEWLRLTSARHPSSEDFDPSSSPPLADHPPSRLLFLWLGTSSSKQGFAALPKQWDLWSPWVSLRYFRPCCLNPDALPQLVRLAQLQVLDLSHTTFLNFFARAAYCHFPEGSDAPKCSDATEESKIFRYLLDSLCPSLRHLVLPKQLFDVCHHPTLIALRRNFFMCFPQVRIHSGFTHTQHTQISLADLVRLYEDETTKDNE